MRTLRRCLTVNLLVLATLAAVSPAVAGPFVLNFTPHGGGGGGDDDDDIFNHSCNRGSRSGGCNENDIFRGDNGSDRTPFLMELFSSGGQRWWHVIIGLPGQDFVQQAYIKATRGGGDNDQGPISDGLGSTSTSSRNLNAADPRGPLTFSGSGSANPNSAVFRQLLNSNGMVQDITKTELAQKHKLTQSMSGQNADIDFVMDMTNSTFSDANTAGIMTNKLTVNDAEFNNIPDFPDNFPGSSSPPSSRRFDVAVDGKDVRVSGGKYRYVTYGQYAGEGKGFDLFSYNWDLPVDPAQNAGHLYGGSGKGD